MSDRRKHTQEKILCLEVPYLRELAVDLWGLRGFGIAYRHEGEGADFVATREKKGTKETEVVSVAEGTTKEDARGLSEAAGSVGTTHTLTPRAVAVSKRFGPGARGKARELGVETVDAERLADLTVRGGYYWVLYRWVALNEAGRTEDPTVTGGGEAPLRHGNGAGGVSVGHSTANRIGADDGDVVRIGGEIAGVTDTGGVFERDTDYVAIGEGDTEAVDAEEGDAVTVEVLDTKKARRIYVMSQPEVDAGLAAEIWDGYAPHRGTELSQPYEDGEIRTMAIEVLPQDYCYVDEETDVVTEGYEGARRVFE